MHDYDSVLTVIDARVREMAKLTPDDAELQPDTNVFHFGFIDSFGAVELVEFVERTFGIEVTDDDLAKRPLNTLREISEFVVLKLGTK